DPETAEATLGQAKAIVQEQIDRIERLPTAYRQLQAINDRVRAVETFVARQGDLIDTADAAADAGKPLAAVADQQAKLGPAVAKSADTMTVAGTWQKTLREQLKSVAPSVDRAAVALREGTGGSIQQTAAMKELEDILQSLQHEQGFMEKSWSLMQLAGGLRDF